MSTERKKRNKISESDEFEDGHSGDLNLTKKKKKKKHRLTEDVMHEVNSFDMVEVEGLTEFSNNHCNPSKVGLKKIKNKSLDLDIDPVENSKKSENQSKIDLNVSHTSCLLEFDDVETRNPHELCSDLKKQGKKSKKKKHKPVENSPQLENSYEIVKTGSSNEHDTKTVESTELSISSTKKKEKKNRSKSSVKVSIQNVDDHIQPELNQSSHVLGANSLTSNEKLSKDNILDQNVGIKSITEQEEGPHYQKLKTNDLDKCDFKNNLSPSKSEKSINRQLNSETVDKKIGSLLNPNYLQNKKIENSNQFMKRDSGKSFSEAKLLKKEEQKSRYPDTQDETIELSDGRHFTISIAIPASILEETCLLHELRTYVIGQLARAASIFSVDEIVVYNDQCWRSSAKHKACIEDYIGMMKMILEYQECPQYLRRDLIPRHPCLSKVGVLNALNAPHHLLSSQWCTYREGVVLDKNQGKVSFVDVGLKNYVQIDRKLEPGLRVTVKFPPEVRGMKKFYGSVVSPHEPRIKGGLYWGYSVRVANSLPEVFESEDFQEGYDLIIGTSDKGDNINDTELKTFKHALIVFGGVDGLEIAMEADATVKEKNPRNLFPYYLNCCPDQQSRTIRTEEAVFITLSSLSQKLKQYGSMKPS